jgi:GNAT superfamily N-acetyltransferase
MIIRGILESELDKLIALYADYTEKENLPPLSRDRIQEIWREVERNPGVHYFVVETEKRIAAACILSITPSFIRGGKAYGVIEHVVTHRNFRRQGLARALMMYTLEFAWDHDCTEVMLLSGKDSRPAHKMYRNLGFKDDQRLGFIIFRQGE